MTRSARRFLLALLLGVMALIALLLFELAPALLLAIVLTVLLWPVQQWLSARLRNNRTLAAGLLVFGVCALIITPLVAMSAFLVREATEGVRFVTDTMESEGFEGLIEKLPAPLEKAANSVIEKLPEADKLELQVGRQGGNAAAAVGGVVAATGSMLFQTAMMLIALFFFLVEGAACVQWLDRASPLRSGQTQELLAEFKKVARSVVVSVLVTAAVQAAAALAGFLIARVPHPLFFTTVTFGFALIPAIGAASITCAAAALLLILGHPYFALFLALWGVLVVGLVDNLIKPLLIKGNAELDGAVVFFSLIGGIAAFGTIGILVGPLAVALFLALLRIYQRDALQKPRLRAAA